MLYCLSKIGVPIPLESMGMNVLIDLINYSTDLDALTIAKAEGKSVKYTAPMNLADMTAKGKMRG